MRDQCCSHSCGDNPSGNPRRNACGAESSWERGLPNGRVAEVHERIRGKARMHTCLDQYKANKATNANGGLKWIEKGGGYYSECNKQLKG
jgi:hypothetical protein